MRITKKWKNILSIGLAVLVLFGAVGAVASFATNDSKPAGAVFKVGGLDPETGKYVKTDKTIYTETAIDAYGLRIEPDFESTVTYDVYLYDNEDNLVEVILGNSEVYVNKYEFIPSARIVIHPEIPEDVKEKDFKVHIWDVAKYANMLTITNSKEESIYGRFDNLCLTGKEIEGYDLVDIVGGREISSKDLVNVIRDIRLGDFDKIDIWIYLDVELKAVPAFAFYKKDGTYIVHHHINPDDFDRPVWTKLTIDLTEFEEEYIFDASIPVTSSGKIYVYGYND